jgi:lia operon protein LiaG
MNNEPIHLQSAKHPAGKRRSLTQLLSGIGLALVILGGASLWLLLGNGDRYAASITEIELNENMPAANIHTIDIRSEWVDVSVKQSTEHEDQIRVRLFGHTLQSHGEDSDIRMKSSGDTASIEISTNPGNRFGMTLQELAAILAAGEFRQLRAEVLLPATMTEGELRIRTTNGDIRMESIHMKQASATSNAGDIVVQWFAGELLDIQTDAGDQIIREFDGRAQLESTLGDIEVMSSTVTSSLSVETRMGDVRLHMERLPEVFGLDLRSTLGDVTVRAPELRYEANGEHEVRGALGSGGPQLQVRSNAGDIVFWGK